MENRDLSTEGAGGLSPFVYNSVPGRIKHVSNEFYSKKEVCLLRKISMEHVSREAFKNDIQIGLGQTTIRVRSGILGGSRHISRDGGGKRERCSWQSEKMQRGGGNILYMCHLHVIAFRRWLAWSNTVLQISSKGTSYS